MITLELSKVELALIEAFRHLVSSTMRRVEYQPCGVPVTGYRLGDPLQLRFDVDLRRQGDSR